MRETNIMKRLLILAVAATLGSGTAAGASENPQPKAPPPALHKLRIFANAAFSTGSIDYSQTRTFRQYQEDGQVAFEYGAESGLGFELGLHYRFNPRLGAMLSFGTGSRDATATYTATVPHPFFLSRPRTVSGTEDGFSFKETLVHLDFVYRIESGPIEVHLFAGPSYVSVNAEVVSSLDYRETYPFDTLEVSRVNRAEPSDNGFGFNVGAGLDYRFGKTRRFGLGAQVRYTGATLTLAPAEGPTIDVKAGGFQAAAGLRVYF